MTRRTITRATRERLEAEARIIAASYDDGISACTVFGHDWITIASTDKSNTDTRLHIICRDCEAEKDQ